MSASFPGNPWPLTNRSGTITTGGVAQVLMALNSQRRGYWFQNVSAGDLWISAVGAAAAAQPSMKIPPNALFEVNPGTVPTGELSVFGATSAQAFSAREW